LHRATKAVTVGQIACQTFATADMTKSRPSRRQQNADDKRARKRPAEEPPAEAMTVAWTASVMSVFMANLATIAPDFYARVQPESKLAPPFEAIMLLTACFLGLASLTLLVVVWRTSRLKPPSGFAAFAAFVAIAPIIATVARLAVR
jgi:hypothetical protein